MFTTGGCTQPFERPAAQKALGVPIAIGMTSEAEIKLAGAFKAFIGLLSRVQ
jgi:hypothetical protein